MERAGGGREGYDDLVVVVVVVVVAVVLRIGGIGVVGLGGSSDRFHY